MERLLSVESADVLRQRTIELRARLARDGFEDARVVEAFAIIALATARTLGTVPYDTQLVAARVMLDGHLAEMATGEGKTLAVAITAAAAALAGIPVHVVTANDYLVERDAASLRPLYEALGLTMGTVTQALDASARRAAYANDIAYCTAKELVFDYLRDRVSSPRRSPLEERAVRLASPDAPAGTLRGLWMAIIDEADSVLIDEARVPLILSRSTPGDDTAHLLRAWELSAQLEPDRHFILDPTSGDARLTDAGRAELWTLVAMDTFAWLTLRHCEDTVIMALRARHLLAHGRDFVVKGGRVQIIDETTGRTAGSRSWSHGLHQLVEIKEGCAPSARVVPLVQITYQRFFPRYLRLCGTSGTLLESRAELMRIYGKRVVRVPLRRSDRRKRLPARAFTHDEARWAAAVERIRQLRASGQPVLVGTDSVTDSETLSRLLTAAHLPHAVLNARQDRHEASIIAAAGNVGSVTVATNMAGRGTDIVLGAGSARRGGLHVMSCQQNSAARIDRQLEGRCARQGDPGSTEIFISLDGPLLARHWLARFVKRWAIPGELRHAWLGRLALWLAQRAEMRRQETEREWLSHRDREMGEWFAFSGPEV